MYARAHVHRDLILNGLWDAQPDDVLMFSDTDEIPSPEAALALKWCAMDAQSWTLVTYSYTFTFGCSSAPSRDSMALTVGLIGNAQTGVCRICEARYGRLQAVREKSLMFAGWHMSSSGGPYAVLKKVLRRGSPGGGGGGALRTVPALRERSAILDPFPPMAKGTKGTTPDAGLSRFLLSPGTQMMSYNKHCFRRKMPECRLTLLSLPHGRSSPGGGRCSGWSREC